MLSRVRSTAANDSPTALTNELAQARQTYETRKENVLGRAGARLVVIENLQADLDREYDQLDTLVREAN